MRKVNTRGIVSAHKSMLMAAIAYNLRKYMKYYPKKINLIASTVKNAVDLIGDSLTFSFFAVFKSLRLKKSLLN
jgi:hypothetical protein